MAGLDAVALALAAAAREVALADRLADDHGVLAVLRGDADLRAGRARLRGILDPDDRIVRRIGGFLLDDLGVLRAQQELAQLGQVRGIVAALRDRPLIARSRARVTAGVALPLRTLTSVTVSSSGASGGQQQRAVRVALQVALRAQVERARRSRSARRPG